MAQKGQFKVQFDIRDYTDILPDWREYVKHDEILNYRENKKGNVDNCYWQKHRPTPAEIASPEWREREITRIIKTGVWIFVKDEPIWIPPNLYFAYQYCPAGSADMQFRLSRIKHAYFKIRARKNNGCKGTLTIKGRGSGETTMAITDSFWECLDGNMDAGQIGIQSYSRNAAINPCWSYVQTLWQTLPRWIKSDLCSDFISGTNIAEKMQWMKEADESTNTKARNVLLTYYPSGTPMDGKHDVKKCVLDEVCKWRECSFYGTFTNYSKFIMPGFERRGMFDMFSSPADEDCESNAEVYQLWQDSDPNEITENGTTKSRIHRYYSNPLEGIAGSYDKFGDADPKLIYEHIMRERKKMPKDKLLGEIRGFPLNEQEMFESTDNGSMWSNQAGINARKIYLMGTRFKDAVTQEPTVVFGNLDWVDGIKDFMPVWRQSDSAEFDVHNARFCFSYLPQGEQEPMDNIFNPPNYVQNCIGIDSVDKRYAGKRPSNFAMVNTKFLDIENSGIVKCPTMFYLNRPLPVEIAYEDAIKCAVFLKAKIQVESLNSAIVNYFEDRKYINWMLSKIGLPQNSLVKGDAPSGKTAFMDEIVAMLDAVTNVPVNDGDQYLLELNWFYELLDDVSKFNLKDTHARDGSMAWGQSLLGCAKLLHKKSHQPSSLNNMVLEFFLG